MKITFVLLMSLALAGTAAAQGPPPNDSGPLPTIRGVSGKSRVEPRFSTIASLIAGQTRAVRCWSVADWRRLGDEWSAFTDYKFALQRVDGYTSDDHERANLAPETCAQLVSLAYKRQWPKSRAGRVALAEAVETLAHEAHHLKGIDDEATAECYGQQFTRYVARQLGASRAHANVLARLGWTDYYLPKPKNYHSAECRDGGALDLHPTSNIWP